MLIDEIIVILKDKRISKGNSVYLNEIMRIKDFTFRVTMSHVYGKFNNKTAVYVLVNNVWSELFDILTPNPPYVDGEEAIDKWLNHKRNGLLQKAFMIVRLE